MDEGLLEYIRAMALYDKLEDVEWAYHVTNIPRTNDTPPNWLKLEWSLADDPCYDGPLVGFPCVFFTTTLYKDKENLNLPNKSMYPRGGQKDVEYWRVRIPLNHFRDYTILFCHEAKPRNVTQVKLVLAKPNWASILQEKLFWKEEKAKVYLQMLNYGEVIKWRSNFYETGNKDHNAFVNFVIFGDVDIPKESLWDSVKHTATMDGSPNRENLAQVLTSAMVKHRWQ